MVNFGGTFSSLIGLGYLSLSIVFPILTIVLLTKRANELTSLTKVLYGIQAIVAPIVFVLVGKILLLQGWRLDPILAFSQLLLLILILYLGVKEFLIMFVERQR
jgi:Ycf66 protein N-terminus